ncbi:MAG: hydrogenase maturation nickel metallochaperone HypA [Deltaproteobacteria bacterium]|nr:hydrogenase maturation nickel metallochaperone HypA [Deltaproteobacteria bacterium]
MHEITIASEMIRQIEKIMADRGVSRLVSVSVEVGALSGVEREPLEFCFPYAARGTMAEDARLFVTEVPVRVRCGACGTEGSPEYPAVLCPVCASYDVEIIGGQDCVIRNLEVR